MHKLFVFLGKLGNLLGVMILATVGIAAATWYLGPGKREPAGVAVAPKADGRSGRLALGFGHVEDIRGSDVQMINLIEQDKGGTGLSSGYGSSHVRNVLFLIGADKQVRWLFKAHGQQINAVAQLHAERPDDTAPTRALYVQFINEDSDGDGELNAADPLNVGLSHADGTGFVEVLHGIDRVFSRDLTQPNQLSIVYQKNDTIRHAKVDVDTLKLVSDQELVPVPKV